MSDGFEQAFIDTADLTFQNFRERIEALEAEVSRYKIIGGAVDRLAEKRQPILSLDDVDKIRKSVDLCYSALEDTSSYIGRLARKRLLPAWRILGVDND